MTIACSNRALFSSRPQFYFNGVKRGYVLSKEDRESFVAYVDEVVREKVNAMPGRELIKVKVGNRYTLGLPSVCSFITSC